MLRSLCLSRAAIINFTKTKINPSLLLQRVGNHSFTYKVPRLLLTRTGFCFILPIGLVFAQSNDKQKIISAADEFYSALKYKDSYTVLQQLKDSGDVEVLWRLGRALLNLAQEDGVTHDEKKALIQEGYDIMQKALAINSESHAVHKYTAMLLSVKTDLEGIKAKIHSLPEFQEHIHKAIDLNPQDAMSQYMLGQFHYILSELPWIQKKLVATLFGRIPDTSFEEAASYFSKAEETSPNFYCKNLLLLGKTYLKLGMTDTALHWLQRAATCNVITLEDKAVKKEAEDLLKKYSI